MASCPQVIYCSRRHADSQRITRPILTDPFVGVRGGTQYLLSAVDHLFMFV